MDLLYYKYLSIYSLHTVDIIICVCYHYGYLQRLYRKVRMLTVNLFNRNSLGQAHF
jgi:hypothetical protein